MLIMSVSGLMGLMSLGLGDATIRYVSYYLKSNDISGVNRVFRATLSVYLVTGIFTLLMVFCSASQVISMFAILPTEQDLAVILLKLTSINFLITLVGSAISAVPQAFQRYDVCTKISIIATLFQSMLTIVLVYQHYGIIALLYLGIVANLFIAILNYRAAKTLLPELDFTPIPSLSGLKEVFGYGIFAFISQIFGIAFSYSDRLLIGIFVSSASVGYLTVPQDLALRALSLVVQGGSVLFPRFSVIDDSSERLRLYLNATWAMLFFSSIIFVPLTVFIGDFISLWIGTDFAMECSKVGQLIAFSSIIRGAFVIYEVLFKGINKPQYITILASVVGVTSLGLSAIFIPRYGLAGAGYSYCITALWGVVTLIVTWKYILNCNSYRSLFRVVMMPVLLAIFCVGLGFVLKFVINPTNWILLISEVICVIVATALILIYFEKSAGKQNNSAEIFLNGIRNALLIAYRKV